MIACLTVPTGSTFGSGWSAQVTLLVATVALSALASLLFLASHTRGAYTSKSVLDVLREIDDIEATFPQATEARRPAVRKGGPVRRFQ